jgi:hypothetical protein
MVEPNQASRRLFHRVQYKITPGHWTHSLENPKWSGAGRWLPDVLEGYNVYETDYPKAVIWPKSRLHFINIEEWDTLDKTYYMAWYPRSQTSDVSLAASPPADMPTSWEPPPPYSAETNTGTQQ